MELLRFIAITAGRSGTPCPRCWWWLCWLVWWGPCPFSWGALWRSLSPRALGRRLGGHTGDSYGAVLVLTEMITLLGLALLLPAS
jgi:cobalamin synthase